MADWIRKAWHTLFGKKTLSKPEPAKTSVPKFILTKEKIVQAKARKVVLTFDKIYVPTVIQFPSNELRIGKPMIAVRGKAHPGDYLVLKLSSLEPMQTNASANGFFEFRDVRLQPQRNTLTVFNQTREKKGLANSTVSVAVFYDVAFAPYHNRKDPITQINLSTVSADEIVRCRICQNYQLRQSWVDGKNGCAVPPACPGKQYWQSQDDEFWQS